MFFQQRCIKNNQGGKRKGDFSRKLRIKDGVVGIKEVLLNIVFMDIIVDI